MSIDSIEVDTIPGFQVSAEDVTTSVSITYNGLTYGKEWFKLYGQSNDYGTRFILNRLGYVGESIGFKVRTVSSERLNFSFIKVSYA